MHNGRPWFTAVVALVGGMVGAGTMMFGPSSAFALRHPPATRTVEAEEFVLLGPNRARRGVIEVSDKGTAALYLNDENGKERAELTVAADGRAALGFLMPPGTSVWWWETAPHHKVRRELECSLPTEIKSRVFLRPRRERSTSPYTITKPDSPGRAWAWRRTVRQRWCCSIRTEGTAPNSM